LLDAAASHPDGEGSRMMVPSHQLRAAARLVLRRAPELAAPDDERRVQQPALLQIADESGSRSIGFEA
jgi:hypothetical protein